MPPPMQQTQMGAKRPHPQGKQQGGKQQIAGAKVEEWDEQKIEQSLEYLRELHLKVRDLRTAVPRMLEPLTEPQSASPEAMFTEFKYTMTTATLDINSLKETLNSPQIKSILLHADQSRAQSPKGIKQWRPRDEPNWAER